MILYVNDLLYGSRFYDFRELIDIEVDRISRDDCYEVIFQFIIDGVVFIEGELDIRYFVEMIFYYCCMLFMGKIENLIKERLVDEIEVVNNFILLDEIEGFLEEKLI